MESPSKYSGFLSCLEKMDFETSDSRLENLRQFQRTSRELTKAQASRDSLQMRKIPSLQVSIVNSEARLGAIRGSANFDPSLFAIETKKLGELMREEAEETGNLR